MTKEIKKWLAGAAGLIALGLIMIAAIGAHVAGLGQSEAEAAAASARCSTSGQAGNDPETAAINGKVKEMLAGSGHVNVPGISEPRKQVPNAKIIVATGIEKRVPARGQIIALATALQESTLINLDHGDRDSLGLFQQRPSQGWGTREQILNPVYASGKFYDRLLQLRDWAHMPVTVAAQKVQRSGFPDAYAKHEPLATALQQAIAPPAWRRPSRADARTGRPRGRLRPSEVRQPGRRRLRRDPARDSAGGLPGAGDRTARSPHRDPMGSRSTRHAVPVRRKLHEPPRQQPG
ncbi:hypothetical protein ACFQ71_40780 [Streptomyces sp. NPDC056534]|uniref:hypothetical protein n=1 Tax=Streptomyces sp. NPDC056534 TaxID=3345857 RepID=UPI0036937B0C